MFLRFWIVCLIFVKIWRTSQWGSCQPLAHLSLRTSFFKREHHKKQIAEQIERLKFVILLEMKDYFVRSKHWKAFKRSSGTKLALKAQAATTMLSCLILTFAKNVFTHLSVAKLTYPTQMFLRLSVKLVVYVLLDSAVHNSLFLVSFTYENFIAVYVNNQLEKKFVQKYCKSLVLIL